MRSFCLGLVLSLVCAGSALAQVPGQPYLVPAGYEGYGAGTTVAYGGYNYVIQGNGTMLLATAAYVAPLYGGNGLGYGGYGLGYGGLGYGGLGYGGLGYGGLGYGGLGYGLYGGGFRGGYGGGFRGGYGGMGGGHGGGHR